MDKPRVVFPYTEAGLGHIMPMNSIADEFERLYGDKVEVVRSQFFKEQGNKKLMVYEKELCDNVVYYNRHPFLGYFATFNMRFWGVKLSSWGAIDFIGWGACKEGIKHMEELKPDLVVSTHWATNYYAMHIKDRPLTVMYCPDVWMNTLFRYPCDLALLSMSRGYNRAMKMHKKRFNEQNLKLVPFLIRKEAFEITADKVELRREIGIDEDKFTVLVADGGYGIGKCKETCEELLKRDLPINLIVVCGRNEEMYNYLSGLKSKGRTVFKTFGLADNMLEIIASSDVICGKSGASLMAEPCFFGVPQIITHYANEIEKRIGEYYIDEVGSAIKQFNVANACNLIEEFAQNPERIAPYREAALKQKANFGAEKSARYIFGLLCKKFPELKDGTELY
ncbi:MAG: glycosyltransferase [Candidatus Coproplasma sp.]